MVSRKVVATAGKKGNLSAGQRAGRSAGWRVGMMVLK
jgi:hypothetical protein